MEGNCLLRQWGIGVKTVPVSAKESTVLEAGHGFILPGIGAVFKCHRKAFRQGEVSGGESCRIIKPYVYMVFAFRLSCAGLTFGIFHGC